MRRASPPGSVAVPMVQVGRMRVAVAQRAVVVRVAVCALGHHRMGVVVVAVVVGVGVFVVQRLVLVDMPVVFGQVHQHPRHHQCPAAQQQQAGRTLAERERDPRQVAGARGAVMYRRGVEMAWAVPPMLASPATTSPPTGAACADDPQSRAKAKGSCRRSPISVWPRARPLLADCVRPRTCSEVATQVPKVGLQTERWMWFMTVS